MTTFFLLRAFPGCTALTGGGGVRRRARVRARAKNARIVLAWLGVILVTLFAGITFLRHITDPIPERAMVPSSPDRSSVASLLRSKR